MPHRLLLAICFFLLSTCFTSMWGQTISGMDEDGTPTQFGNEGSNGNGSFNPHRNDTTKKTKEVPKGIYTWTVDRKLGDIQKVEVDTLPHLYPQSTMAMGKYMQYNTTGSNYTPRLSRIFIDRPENQQFLFTQLYDQIFIQPEQQHFTNTLSPITNISYDNCGNKQDGEDHIQAKFAVNAGKRIGLGFDLNYAYARGYFQNQSTSHFNTTIYGSYLGDQYQAHLIYNHYHQKASENGGITNDDYITHPELFTDSYSDNEIPTVLSSNWNRNDGSRLFLTHRYSVGFYRDVPMTEDEIKAKKFAKEAQSAPTTKGSRKKSERSEAAPKGRPQDAKIVGIEPQTSSLADSTAIDSTRISVTSKAQADSLLAQEALKDSLDAFMKKEYVPVTSFIHTLELENFDHIYQAYTTPENYYLNTRYNNCYTGYPGDSIYDMTTYSVIKNTLGIAMMEGFNKWAKAGIKLFGTHELRHFEMPQADASGNIFKERWTEHNLSIGGRINKTQGNTLHYNLTAETWLVGEDAGQLKLDFQTDLNFPLFGDTVTLAAKAYFHRLNPTFYERHYHAKHLWWDNDDLSMTTRTRAEGIFSYKKTKTRLRVAVEEMQNYTHWTMSYANTDNQRTALTGGLHQCASNINVLTAQLEQPLALGPLHWDNVITYQSSSQKDVLPLPALNIFSNLYLQFVYAKVLRIELGAAATWFSKYEAPDYLPQMAQYAIQQNDETRIELGNFPFVDVYANLHLKHARFFVMMSNATGTSFNRMAFLTPHYTQNRSVLHMGVSWNFFN